MMHQIITEVVIPVVVTSIWEDWVVIFPHNQTVLIVPVVRLAVTPVKPVDSGVSVGPVPFTTIVVCIMTTCSFGSKPELIKISRTCHEASATSTVFLHAPGPRTHTTVLMDGK